MFKKILVCLMVLCFSAALYAATPPKLSGNIEQGTRYALPYDDAGFPTPWVEATEQSKVESWAYNYHKGFLQVAQKVSSRLRYVVKYNYIWKDFIKADNTNKNLINYYQTYAWIKLNPALDLKVEYYLRHQDYYYMPWNNLTHVPYMYLKWKISDKRKANAALRFKAQRYADPGETWKNKNETVFNLGYKEEVGKSLVLRTEYKYTFRHYTNNIDEKNASKKALSAGFEYQF